MLTIPDPDLLARAPLTARKVAFAGPDARALMDAYRRRNPAAELFGELDRAPFDLILAQDLAAADSVVLARALGSGGWLIAGFSPGADAIETLRRAGLHAAAVYPVTGASELFDDPSAAIPASRAGDGPAQRRIVVARKSHLPPPAPLALRIVAFAPRFLDLRARLPAHALRADPALSVAYQHAPFTVPRAAVTVLQRPALTELAPWRETLAFAIHLGSIIVLEVDDNPGLLAQANRRPDMAGDLAYLAWPHAIQTSTPELGDLFRRHNPEVAVFPNAVFDLPPFPDRPFAPKLFYGALPRGDFPARVAASLGPAIAAFPRAEFTVVGDRAAFEALPTARKTFHEVLPYAAYLDRMAESSVLLTPLEGALYDGKSDAKFLEAAARGLLTIASPAAYAGSVRHGETGLIAPTLNDWSPRVVEALSNPAASQVLARRAWEAVRDSRMFGQQAAARAAWYRDLMDRREALNAAAMARIPGLAEMVDRLARGERV